MTVFYSASSVVVVAYIFFRTSAIMKSLYEQADRINTSGKRKAAANQGRTILKNIERLHVTSFWIGILILWVICLGLALIIDDGIHTSLYSESLLFLRVYLFRYGVDHYYCQTARRNPKKRSFAMLITVYVRSIRIARHLPGKTEFF